MEWICDRCGVKIKPYKLLCPECEKWLEESVKKDKESEDKDDITK